MESPKENMPEEKQNHLKALCLKYGLEKKGEKYVLKKKYSQGEIRHTQGENEGRRLEI